MSSPATSFAPLSMATGQPVQLAMQRLWLTGQVLPAGARLIAQHVFQSQEKQPLEVIYSFPLPRDAALRRFRVTGEGFAVESELKPTHDAVKTYEEGIMQGSLSTLARQYGDGMMNLTVGNIRPGETVTVWLEILAGVELRGEGLRFRFPFTLADNYHPHAKAAEIAPGESEVELPADQFGDLILPRFRVDTGALHQIGFNLSLTGMLDLDEVGSPSHPVRVKNIDTRTAAVTLATGQDIPNRDLVLDGQFKPPIDASAPQILAGRDKDNVGHFAAIIPTAAFGPGPEKPRRLVILLDRSGSMGGAPIEQAKKAIEACLAAFSEADSFALIAFDNVTEILHPSLQPATRQVRDEACRFLEGIHARGGTELAAGVDTAARILAGGPGDILILTDGQVMGTEKILETARATRVRLHCLGIGAASQDRFLTLLARETGGIGRYVTPHERVDLATVDLFSSIGHAVATGVKAGASIQPQPPTAVFSGTPLLLFGEGDGPLELAWDGGSLHHEIAFTADAIAETLWLLQGARLITDWESRYASEDALAPLEQRKQNRIAMRLVELSRKYGLANREMSLVAVVKRAGDRPDELPETQVVPVGILPRSVRVGQSRARAFVAPAAAAASLPVPMQSLESLSPSAERRGFFRRLSFRQLQHVPADEPEEVLLQAMGPPPDADTIRLIDLSRKMEPDGGMPGNDPAARVCATLVMLFALLAGGYTPTSGGLRTHVRRLIRYLQKENHLSEPQRDLVAKAIALAEKAQPPAGDWLKLAATPADHWRQIEKALSAK